jgi:hypothetical protein
MFMWTFLNMTSYDLARLLDKKRFLRGVHFRDLLKSLNLTSMLVWWRCSKGII